MPTPTPFEPLSDFALPSDTVITNVEDRLLNLRGKTVKLVDGNLVIPLPTSDAGLEAGELYLKDGAILAAEGPTSG